MRRTISTGSRRRLGILPRCTSRLSIVHGRGGADGEDGQQGFLALAEKPCPHLFQRLGMPFVTALVVVAANCLLAPPTHFGPCDKTGAAAAAITGDPFE